MPELPEVQTIVNDLRAARLEGQTIKAARVFWARTIAVPSAKAFCNRIKGQTIQKIRRRGKFIVFELQSGSHLLMHLRMSGRLHLVSVDQPRKKHEHVLLHLDGRQQLRFHDTRKFGRLYLTPETDSILGRLGPEPLSKAFTQKKLALCLKPRKRLLKPLLLDQSFIAGLGNIYVDEALWESKIHPCRMAAALTAAEIQALHRAIRRVLRRGLNNLGTSLGTGKTNFYSIAKHRGRNSDQLNVFRRTGRPCPRCHTEIERIIVGQRSTHICPACQRTEVREQRSEHR